MKDFETMFNSIFGTVGFYLVCIVIVIVLIRVIRFSGTVHRADPERASEPAMTPVRMNAHRTARVRLSEWADVNAPAETFKN